MAETYPLVSLESTSTGLDSDFEKLNKIAEKRAKSCVPAPMPSLDHLSLSDYDLVYEPSDDTYLFLDGLNIEFGDDDDKEEEEGGGESNSENKSSIETTLEIGSGTGVLTTFLAMLLATSKKPKVVQKKNHYVTDINPDAIRISLQTAESNQNSEKGIEFKVNAIECDLASDLLPRMDASIDCILFNPPYVPTPIDEVGTKGIEASWAGGPNGRIVLDRCLPQIARLLKWPHGCAYIITVDENKPQEIAEHMMIKYGIKVTPLVRRKAKNEYLTLQKMTLTRELSFDK